MLVDSYEAHFQSWQALARETGVNFAREDFTRTFGRTSREVLGECWPAPVLAAFGIQELDHRKEANFRAIIEKNVPIMPGAIELIDALVAASFRLAVGSSAPPENIHLVLRAMGRSRAFAACVTGNDVTRGKPDAQVFLMAAERLSLPPACCVVIEDAPSGVEAAHRAGMRCIGLVSTGRTHSALAQADHIVSSLSELTPGTLVELTEPSGKKRANQGF